MLFSVRNMLHNTRRPTPRLSGGTHNGETMMPSDEIQRNLPSDPSDCSAARAEEIRQRKIDFQRWNIEGLERDIKAKQEGLEYAREELARLLSEER